MRALFEVARARQPSFIFFDEVDSMLSARGGSGEHEASRKLKTEFLTQVDGAGRAEGEAVYVMAATNRPQDLDDAVLRRLSKRIHVPLPRTPARLALLRNLTVDSTRSKQVKWNLSSAELKALAAKMPYFSGADIHALVREASLMVRPARLFPLHVRSQNAPLTLFTTLAPCPPPQPPSTAPARIISRPTFICGREKGARCVDG